MIKIELQLPWLIYLCFIVASGRAVASCHPVECKGPSHSHESQ